MLFHPSSFIAALLLGLLLHLLAVRPETFFWIMGGVVLLALRNARTADRHLRALPEAALFAVSSTVLLSFIDHPTERSVFIGLAALAHYLFLLGLVRLRQTPRDTTAKAFLDTAATVTLFLAFAGAYGIYLNFDIPAAALMLAYGLSAWFVSGWHLRLAAGEGKGREASLYALIIALVMAEIGWATSLWPFGYLMSGVTALMFYHALVDLADSALRGHLSVRQTLLRILLFFSLAALLLATSRWFPAF